MRKTLAVVALLAAVGASAGTITSLDPSTIVAGSGEYFMTIYGTDLGDQLRFDGPAGSFTVDINARFTTPESVVGWVPMPVALDAGAYTVTVLGGNSGDSGPASFRVVGPPKTTRFQINLPESLAAIAVGKGAYVRFTVGASGGEGDPNPVVRCDPESGAFFGVGTTVVNCIASSAFGETDKGSFPIFVHDVTRPVLQLPGRIVVAAESKEGSLVRFETSASDDVDGALRVDCDAKSGQLFPIGITTVNCVATDLSLNPTYGAFTVEVVDQSQTRLTLHVPDSVFAEAETADGARATFDVYVTGTTDPNPKIICDPESGSLFRMGSTPVYCKATDAFGGSAEGKFIVTVADTTGPIIDGIAARPDTFDALGDYVAVTVEVKAFDVIDPMPRCSINTVYANETIDPKDYSIVSDLEVKLHAVTLGADNRVYHVVVDCSDASGNPTLDEALVTVVSRGGGGADETAPTTTRRRSVRP